MYERFTDRARKVTQLANAEAIRLNHEYIGTEHILLAIMAEGSGVAAHVLKNFRIDGGIVRREVEKIVQRGPKKEIVDQSGFIIRWISLLLGQFAPSNLPPKNQQTPRAKKIIEYAMEEARNLNHNYVGTEHLLLGLLREPEGVAHQVLTNLGLELDDVRNEVLNILGCAPSEDD
ncbi:MAG: Clp protease N-terminal domain-containing protein [Planctomycetaceae bacterium]